MIDMKKIYVLMLTLFLFHYTPVSAFPVDPMAGENQWRIIYRIGACLDIVEETILSVSDFLCSKIISIDSANDVLALSISDSLSSRISVVDADLLSISDFLCAKVISVSDSLSLQINEVDTDLISVSDVLTSLTESGSQTCLSIGDSLSTQINTVDNDLLSVGDVLCSKVMNVDTTLVSVSDALSSTLELIESKVDLICTCDTMINSLPYTITSPGTYCLAADLSIGSGLFGIEVSATTDVLIDFCGHYIDGQGNASIGVSVVNSSRVTIKNGTIRDFDDFGILTGSSNEVTMQGLRIANIGSNDTARGILINNGSNLNVVQNCEVFGGAGVGIYAGQTGAALTTPIIRDCSIYNQGNGGIVFGTLCTSGRILRCVSYDIQGDFAYSLLAPDSSCDDSFVRSCTGGILLAEDAFVVRRCVVEAVNDNPGCYINGGFEGTIEDCIFGGGNAVSGLVADDAHDVVIQNCKMIENDLDGILVTENATNIQIIGCFANKNGVNGIEIPVPGSPATSLAYVFNCIATNNGGADYLNVPAQWIQGVAAVDTGTPGTGGFWYNIEM